MAIQNFDINFFSNHLREIVIMVLAIVVYALTFVIKVPIKHLTKRIQDEYKRKMINKTIILLPFGLGLLAQFIYNSATKTIFDYNAGLTIGLSAVSIYATLEKVIKGKSKTEYDTEDGKEIIKEVKELIADIQPDKEMPSANSILQELHENLYLNSNKANKDN